MCSDEHPSRTERDKNGRRGRRKRKRAPIYKMENRRLNSAAAAAMTAAVGVALNHSWQARAHKQAAESEMAVEAPKQLSVEKEDSKIETPGKCPARERAQTGACSQGLEKNAPDFVCGPKFDIGCSCGVAPESVLDDIGVDDEHATIVIIGGGPHALAALSALDEKSLRLGANCWAPVAGHTRRILRVATSCTLAKLKQSKRANAGSQSQPRIILLVACCAVKSRHVNSLHEQRHSN